MKWTVLFIIHGLEEGLHEQSRVLKNVISYGNWSLKYINLLYLKSEIGHSGKGKSINAVLNKVNSLKDRQKDAPDVTRVRKFSNINIGNKQKLTNIFSYVRKNFPAEKLMLLVFDHGAGFGIFDAIPDVNKSNFYPSSSKGRGYVTIEQAKGNKYSAPAAIAEQFSSSANYKALPAPALSPIPETEPVGQLRYFGRKYAKTDMLTMEELSLSIEMGFKKKVDVMVLVNCNMQMLETGYSLQKNVDYLVGSESLFWVYGINYREVIWQLDNLHYISPEKVALLCIKSLRVRYERIKKERNLNDVSFSAINLQKMKPVYEKLDELAGVFVEDIAKYAKAIGKARKAGADLSQFNYTEEQQEAYEPLFFYDLLHLMECTAPKDKRVKELRQLMSKAIVDKYIGSDFKKGGKSIVNGVSVYCPYDAEDFGMKYYGLFYKEKAKFKVDFADTNWGKLIRAIKKQVGS